jgi:hypothetical protein
LQRHVPEPQPAQWAQPPPSCWVQQGEAQAQPLVGVPHVAGHPPGGALAQQAARVPALGVTAAPTAGPTPAVRVRWQVAGGRTAGGQLAAW